MLDEPVEVFGRVGDLLAQHCEAGMELAFGLEEVARVDADYGRVGADDRGAGRAVEAREPGAAAPVVGDVFGEPLSCSQARQERRRLLVCMGFRVCSGMGRQRI